MKGDRFEQIAEKAKWPDDYPLRVVAKLLRKEHAAVVRMVKKIQPDGDDGSGFMCGYSEAKNDILAALAKRAKGGTK